MLNFFRKYQKIFFIFIATITIISFTFFGTQRAMDSGQRELPNRDLVKGIDGKWIGERDVKGMAYLLDPVSGLSDGLLEKDLLATGLSDILGTTYFSLFKKDLEEKLSRVKNYRPYAHPQAPFLSAETVWSHFSPELSKTLAELQEKSETSPETLSLLMKLYAAEKAFPPEMLRRVLSYQQNQFSWLSPDPNLTRGDLSLFRFKSVEDWFGTQFTYVLSEFILNAAAYAEQKGYRVTNEEAYASLLQNGYQTIKTFKPDATSAEAEQYLVHNLQSVGLDQNQGVELWRKALLFRRLFDESAGSLFLDSLVHKEFNSFALEKASLEVFQMPEEFHLSDFRSFLKFQIYLESIASKVRGLALPTHFLSSEEIERRTPELIQRSFQVEMIHVKKEALLQEVSLKATWDWELDEKNWDVLRKEFPVLARGQIEKREERFALLEQVEPSVRLKMDRFAQGKIADMHPEWLEAAFQKNQPKPMTLGIRLEEGSSPLKGVLEGVEDQSILLALLQDAPLKSENPDPYHSLKSFSQDKENYYRIWVIEKSPQREVLTFKDADQEGVLDRLLDKRLETIYPEVRKKDPSLFQLADGSWKSLSEVKNQVGAKLYADLLKSLDDKYGAHKEKDDLDFYAYYRFHPYLADKKVELEKNTDDTSPLSQKKEVSSFPSQWELVSSKEEVSRSAYPQAFGGEIGSLSDILLRGEGNAHFFKVLGRHVDENDVASQVAEQQSVLAKEVRKDLMRQILVLIESKKAIDFSVLTKQIDE